MRMFFLTVLLSLLSSTALAQNVQLKGGTVSIGDSVQKLLQVGGAPDQVRPFPGAPAFTLHEYSFGDRQVNVSVKDGKVTGIADNVIVSKPAPAAPRGVEFNGSVIATGDTLAKLLDAAGQPHRIRTFPAPSDLSVYEYSFKDREVTVTLKNGKVTGTSQMRVVKK